MSRLLPFIWLQDELPPKPVARIGACSEITALAYLLQMAALPGMWGSRKLAAQTRTDSVHFPRSPFFCRYRKERRLPT